MPKKEERSAVATPQNNSIRKRKMSQEDKFLQYLRKYGSITTLEAVRVLYIMNPQQRVKNLRDRGYDIVTERAVSPDGARYGIYRLKEDKDAAKLERA